MEITAHKYAHFHVECMFSYYLKYMLKLTRRKNYNYILHEIYRQETMKLACNCQNIIINKNSAFTNMNTVLFKIHTHTHT